MAAILAACSDDGDPTLSDNGGRVPLIIQAGIDMQARAYTRASETSWEYDDKIGVFVTNHNSKILYTDDAEGGKGNNLLYSFDDGENYETWGNTYRLFTPVTQKLYLSTTTVDVYGYYPYQSLSAPTPDLEGNVSMPSITIDVENQTPQKKIDFMRSRPLSASNSNAAVKLMFEHKLVKLIFNLKQGEGLLSNELEEPITLSLTIKNQPTEATYDIKEDAISIVGGSNQDITPFTAPSAPLGYVRTYEAIVLPSSNTSHKVEIVFYKKEKDKITNTFTIDTSLRSGYKYTFNVTVNAVSVTVDTQKYTEQW
jgi:hypothetical protein